MSTITESKTQRMTNFRWVLCALLFVATTVKYKLLFVADREQ